MSMRMNPYPNGPGQTSRRSDGSRTMTMHDIPTGEQGGSGPGDSGDKHSEEQHVGVLRLRGGGNTRRVVWSSETIDNEGMGKKKSKICCIFHKAKEFDESSDDSSSSDSDDSDSSRSDASSVSSRQEGINASKALRERKAKRKGKSEQCGHNHNDSQRHTHSHDDNHSHSHGQDDIQNCKVSKNRRKGRGGGNSTTIVEKSSEVPEEARPLNKPIPNKYERGFA